VGRPAQALFLRQAGDWRRSCAQAAWESASAPESGPRAKTGRAGESVCAAPGACASGRWAASDRANGSPGPCPPCAGATRRRRARPGAGTGAAACCTAAGAAAGGTDSTAACAASGAGSRAVGHSAGDGGRARRGCGRRASVSAAAGHSGIAGMGAPSASGPGGMAHRAECGLASWATGGDVASMSGAGQRDRASNLRGNKNVRRSVDLIGAPIDWRRDGGGAGRARERR
jgi:hypothetical protein